MHQHAHSRRQHPVVARVTHYQLLVLVRRQRGHRGVSVRAIQGLGPGTRAAHGVLAVGQHAAQEKVVQHHHARHALKHVHHVHVERRITEVIEHAVVARTMHLKPSEIANPCAAADGMVIDL
ncbi:hypothetical protein I5W28_04560 [Stenotrophomonas maltophilia]|nr:hypothetical protein [Stenotrophomonas maltophilia]